jgi:hypothetical protein
VVALEKNVFNGEQEYSVLQQGFERAGIRTHDLLFWRRTQRFSCHTAGAFLQKIFSLNVKRPERMLKRLVLLHVTLQGTKVSILKHKVLIQKEAM